MFEVNVFFREGINKKSDDPEKRDFKPNRRRFYSILETNDQDRYAAFAQPSIPLYWIFLYWQGFPLGPVPFVI